LALKPLFSDKESIAMNEEKNKKHSFTGLGLIFGTAIGAAMTFILTINILWAGIGTGVGLIVGAIIDSSKSKEN
jgi:hypothetical protein